MAGPPEFLLLGALNSGKTLLLSRLRELVTSAASANSSSPSSSSTPSSSSACNAFATSSNTIPTVGVDVVSLKFHDDMEVVVREVITLKHLLT